LVMMSVQFLLMGLMAEMIARTYHESQSMLTYVIRRHIEPSGQNANSTTRKEDEQTA